MSCGMLSLVHRSLTLSRSGNGSIHCIRISNRHSSAGKQHLKAPQSRVYLFNQCTTPLIGFATALDALRAYSLFERPETIDLYIKCNMKLKKDKNRQVIRGNTVFPHKFGKQQRVLVFAEKELVDDAVQAGADIVGGKELIERVSKGKEEFDVCLSTPTMLPDVKNLQNVLRAKMPTARRGLVVEAFTEIISQLKGSREYLSDKEGFITAPVGKFEFSNSYVLDNVMSLIGELLNESNSNPKPDFIESLVLSSTYGPSFQVEVAETLNP